MLHSSNPVQPSLFSPRELARLHTKRPHTLELVVDEESPQQNPVHTPEGLVPLFDLHEVS